MKAFLFIISFISFISIRSNGQVPFVISGEVMQGGFANEDTGNYKKALSYFTQVQEGDSNYYSAVLEIFNCQVADSAFNEAFKTIKSLSVYPDIERKPYLTDLANVYDYLGKSDTAMLLYDSLMKLFPDDNQPYYEKGIVYFRQKKYDDALTCFQVSLMRNPYHFGSHFMLGTIYILQGRLSEAYMALEYSLLVTNNTRLARKAMLLLNSIAIATDEVNNYYSAKDKKYSHLLYDETDQIINAKLALNNEYKLKMAINDNIFRQAQVLMEKLKYDPDDTNFAMQYYVPLLTQVFADDQFEEFMVAAFSEFGLEEVDALAKKKKSEVADVKKSSYAYLNNIRGTRVLNFNARKQAREKYFLYSASDKLTITAYLKDKDKLVYDEGPAVLYKNYIPLAMGNYNSNNKKEGLWKYYYNSGKLMSEEINKDGKITGELIEYYENGNIKKTARVDENEEWTSVDNYDERGHLYSKLKKLSKTRSEKTLFAENGKKVITFEMENGDMADARYKRYFDNGNLHMDFESKGQKYEGEYKEYYYTGEIEEQGIYKNSDKEGDYTTYYKNGKVRTRYAYHNGKLDGTYIVNFENGNINTTGVFKDGKEEGPEVRYDDKGRKYGFIDYKAGVPYSIKFIDDEEKTVFEKKDEKGIYQYSTYYPNGNKNVTYALNKEGNQEGLQTYWFTTGSKKSNVEYKDGKRDGKYTEYHKNGVINIDCTYKDNVQDGYYKDHYYSGQLQTEGWVKEGKKQGTWINYYIDGKRSASYYYNDNDIEGYQNTYNADGKLMSKELYKAGVMTGMVQYDSDGTIAQHTIYHKAEGDYKINHSASTDAFASALKYGRLEGPFTRKYYNGALKEQGYSKAGSRDSNYSYYNSAGVLISRGKYKDGKKDGEWNYYDDLGELLITESYIEDKETGKSILYSKGSVRIVYNYADGDKNGEQVYYGEDSMIAGILIYKDDELTGYTSLDKNGARLPVTAVKNGTANIVTYYPNGKKGIAFNLQESNFKGKQFIYFSNGNVAEERNYSYRLLDGPRKKYTPDGKLFYEVNYKDDNIHGHEIYYSNTGEIADDITYYNGHLHGNCTYTDPKTQQKSNNTFYYGTLLQAAK